MLLRRSVECSECHLKLETIEVQSAYAVEPELIAHHGTRNEKGQLVNAAGELMTDHAVYGGLNDHYVEFRTQR